MFGDNGENFCIRLKLIFSKILERGDSILSEGVNYQRGGMGVAAGLYGGSSAISALTAPSTGRHSICAVVDGVCSQESSTS